MTPMGGDRTIHPRERGLVALIYVFSAIPLFGILIAGAIHFSYRERSETVVFHCRQAIAFQAIFLLIFIFIVLFSLFAFLVGVLSEQLEKFLMGFDRWVFFGIFAFYILSCLYLAWRSLDGEDLDLPIVGARLRGEDE